MLFADDSNDFLVNKTLKDITQNAEALILKLYDCLTLNLDKTTFIIFHSPRKNIIEEFNILKVAGVTIIAEHIAVFSKKLTIILSAFKT